MSLALVTCINIGLLKIFIGSLCLFSIFVVIINCDELLSSKDVIEAY